MQTCGEQVELAGTAATTVAGAAAKWWNTYVISMRRDTPRGAPTENVVTDACEICTEYMYRCISTVETRERQYEKQFTRSNALHGEAPAKDRGAEVREML